MGLSLAATLSLCPVETDPFRMTVHIEALSPGETDHGNAQFPGPVNREQGGRRAGQNKGDAVVRSFLQYLKGHPAA